MTTMDKLPLEAVESQPMVAEIVERLQSGAPFVSLLIDNVDCRAVALESVLDRVVDEDTRLAWVGNPLRSPLTIERFFLQAVGPEADLRVERNPAELARMLARPAGEERRKLIVVQQPDTMNAETREKLAAMAPHWAGGEVAVQLLFTGSTTFCMPPVASSALTVMRPAVPPEEPPAPLRRREAIPLVLLLTLAAFGVLASLAFSGRSKLLDLPSWWLGPLDPPVAEANAVSPMPEPARMPAQPQATPASEAPVAARTEKNGRAAPGAGSSRSAATVDDVGTLRREFDAFLTQRASSMPSLTEAQKDELFQEFLARHRQRLP